MTLLGSFNAVFRYMGKFLGQNLTSNAFLEGQWYLFSAIFLLGAGHVLQKERHVRVDVLYERLSKRSQIYIDIVGTSFFLIPFCVFGIWSSRDFVVESWLLREMSPDAGGLPRYPIKVLVPVSFLILGIHSIFYVRKRIQNLRDLPSKIDELEEKNINATTEGEGDGY